jgi:tetratricopeptide (TPR) repeat protein
MNKVFSSALVFGLIGALVAALFLEMGARNVTEWGKANARDEDYNLLVQGFQRGQLSLPRAVPAGLSRLADPYDPVANARYRAIPYALDDLSYYRGKLYLYFGAAPALLLFWPWAAFTGNYLFQRMAVAVFCCAGFLAALALLHGIWRRYFPQAGLGVAGALAVVLGLATSAPLLLQKADVWEVPIACGYALTMLALGAVWRAWHDEARRGWWLAAAGLAMGLAIASRPSLLFGAALLAIPVGGRRGRPAAALARNYLCALAPLALCGAGVLAYNQLRFGHPADFGEHYQLGLYRQDTVQHFSARFLGFNGWVYFLAPAQWTRHFPFVGEIASWLTPPENHGPVEDPFGVLTNLPVLLAAAAAPLAWRRRPEGERSVLRGLVAAVALLFGASAVTLGLFYGNCSRYEMDFLPALVLLAAIGVFALERALAGRRAWLGVARAGWGLAAAASLAFLGLFSVERYADQRYRLGNSLMSVGRVPEAITEYDLALRWKPDFPDACANLGAALLRNGRVPEAIARDQEALRLAPNSALAHYNLAGALLMAGRREEAQAEYQKALWLRPDLGPGNPAR